MARLNEDGQWIIMMAFIICIIIFFLALIVNESILVGQTTAEGVLEFSKSDIQDLKSVGFRIVEVHCPGGICDDQKVSRSVWDIENISMQRKNSFVRINISYPNIYIHYNNGVTIYNGTTLPI